jgi:hypothetical protein
MSENTTAPDTTTAPPETPVEKLMRINAQMFEGTIKTLGEQNMALHQQVSELTTANVRLTHALGEATERIAKLTRSAAH